MSTVLRSPRWSTTALFLVSGLSFGGFLVRAPSLKVQHGLGDTAFGLLSVLFGVVAIATMRAIAPLLRRLGSAAVARVAVVALPLTVVVLGAVPSTAAYVAAIALVAAANGALDASMNATAVATEQRLGRPILSGCHAAWSVGTTVAMLAGAATLGARVPTAAHLSAAAMVTVPIGIVAGRRLVADTSSHGSAAGTPAPAWTPALLRVGLVGTVLMVAEGAALGWSAVLLHEVRGASLALGATAATAFTAAQTAVRLVGDRGRAAWGDARLFRVGAVVGAAGLGAAALVPDPRAAIAGFALLGLGGATLVPIAYAETGRQDPSGQSAARLSPFVYGGVLAGPAAIGLAAGVVGLAPAIALVAPLLAATAAVFPGASTVTAASRATSVATAPEV
ncbi:MFS transporter [Cellulomonas alba]|uniref:MFS transporter n=1 Tax=Cellulomonas alba TaxID=3053467 RepID=A0ABT7SER8_9CELL|nr:hypothetical protein [Cellulomonas alba]MDM7854539.1 hypothetical protein [Cellulomonas alba]